MSAPTRVADRNLADSFAYCQRLAKRTAKNFYYSFLALPADVRRDMCALYAYMRICDDLGDDLSIDLETRRRSLNEWRGDVMTALETGETNHPVLPALVDVVGRKQIPREALLAVIEGVEMDLSPTRYETFEQLAAYCYHVAGAVGICCVHVWGFEGDEAIDRAIECGLAFQLTNILRDVGEDAAMGRVYLPTEDLDRFGYRREDLAAAVHDERFRRLMAFEATRAREFYRKAEPLGRLVHPAGRPVLAAMRGIYGGLLDELERSEYEVFRRRIELPRWKKLAIVAKAMWL
ncbi:MAG: phytoene/squalene synthase family protein [Planctomycetaceae bacterium]|nr:phytoene/squalene synthase family protein [Planctomycetaceae bacterium]